jgi:hypothetical protein
MQISVHVISNYIKLAERSQITWQYQIMNLDDLNYWSAFMSKNLHFHENQGSEAILILSWLYGQKQYAQRHA